jgi:predicted nucleic acid-binding Zn ribbon protein
MAKGRSQLPDDLSEEERQLLAGIRQRPSRLNATPIRQVMRSLMSRRGYGQTQASRLIDEHWADAVGLDLANATRPGNVSRGVLVVYAESSMVLQELNFQKKQILAKLAELAPQMSIRDLRGRVAAIR